MESSLIDVAVPESADWGDLHASVVSRCGWNYFTEEDRSALLYGSSGRSGFLARKGRRVLLAKSRSDVAFRWDLFSAESMGQSWMERLFDGCRIHSFSPSEMLEAYELAKNERNEHTFYEFQNDAGESISVPSSVKGTSRYRERMSRMVCNISDFVDSNHLDCCYLVLSGETAVGTSPYEYHLRWDGLLNRLISWVRSVVDHPVEYLWSLEGTERGYTHLNVVFVDCAYLMPVSLIVDWWKKQGMGSSPGVNLERVERYGSGRSKVLHYLSKYLVKTVSDARWSGMMSMIGSRTWGVSNVLKARVSRWVHRPIVGLVTSVESSIQNLSEASRWFFVGISRGEVEKPAVGRPWMFTLMSSRPPESAS